MNQHFGVVIGEVIKGKIVRVTLISLLTQTTRVFLEEIVKLRTSHTQCGFEFRSINRVSSMQGKMKVR